MRRILVTLLVAVLLILCASVYAYLENESSRESMPGLVGTPYKELVSPSGFVNTGGVPIALGDFVGKKVVLLEFMRYGCVNCQRSFPYLTLWYEKYKGAGLEIVAIHTPQFAYEREVGNVEKAMEAAKALYPVVLDNEYQTWQVYGNHVWPRTLIIDMNGTIVYDHAGSGGYAETEAKLKELLKVE